MAMFYRFNLNMQLPTQPDQGLLRAPDGANYAW
jgi:hypothetical protein